MWNWNMSTMNCLISRLWEDTLENEAEGTTFYSLLKTTAFSKLWYSLYVVQNSNFVLDPAMIIHQVSMQLRIEKRFYTRSWPSTTTCICQYKSLRTRKEEWFSFSRSALHISYNSNEIKVVERRGGDPTYIWETPCIRYSKSTDALRNGHSLNVLKFEIFLLYVY